MLQVSEVVGNIFRDRRLAEKYRRAKARGTCENLLLSRMEMDKTRLRRMTDHGTDVGLILDAGMGLHHGDVLASRKFIVVMQVAEKVVSLSLRNGNSHAVELAALIGHTIGNRHRPIAVSQGTISFPVQNDSEFETFRKLLPGNVKMKIAEKVFLPDVEVHAHEAL